MHWELSEKATLDTIILIAQQFTIYLVYFIITLFLFVNQLLLILFII